MTSYNAMLTDQPVYYMAEGDDLPQIHVEIEGLDLTLFTSIVLRVRRPGGTVLNKDAIIDDAAEGKFHFEWAQGDIMAGESRAEIILTDALGLESSFPKKLPILLEVRSRV